ncbi:TauD/TfdA family dioxygenase [Leptospira idonii]|uniref:TauD/TfdA-like domain-containing protein n=1 Tax=Leptospira idonii TaxID=1193500 RepID=A0A4V3JY90_9LEPT|nr:TauD/TfdA family dioxygenase [Leptospira idonii]TGN19096.1 hypothetical protein EHS15_10550 [Leptospira idonii]
MNQNHIKINKCIQLDQIECIVSEFGELANIDGINKFHDISPGRYRSKNSLSFRYELGSFPYHSDTAYWQDPAKYLVLYCKNPGSGNRTTKFISLEDILNSQIKESILFENYFLIRKNFSSFYSRAITKLNNSFIMRYDIECMTPMNRNAEDFALFMSEIEKSIKPYEHKWEPGDLLIIDNKKTIHARSFSHLEDTDRILRRGLII